MIWNPSYLEIYHIPSFKWHKFVTFIPNNSLIFNKCTVSFHVYIFDKLYLRACFHFAQLTHLARTCMHVHWTMFRVRRDAQYLHFHQNKRLEKLFFAVGSLRTKWWVSKQSIAAVIQCLIHLLYVHESSNHNM